MKAPVWCEPCRAIHPEGSHTREWIDQLTKSTLANLEGLVAQAAARDPSFEMADDVRARILAEAEEKAKPRPGPKIWMPGDPEDPDA